MAKPKKLPESERQQLIEELSKKYEQAGSTKHRFVFLRKKYAWIFVVAGAALIKRFLDITLSLIGMVILSPLFLVISCMIKAYDGGPVLYVTDRVGKGGKIFRFPKFRTMVIHADVMRESLIESTKHIDRGKSFKMEKDPRITRIGRFLRKTSLDELPQLWCVMMGEMSLVGPRPPLPKEVSHYSLEEMKRLDITPGLTCIWQVEGRSEIPFSKQIELDLEYIESQSLWLDFKILLRTIPAVLFGRGAY